MTSPIEQQNRTHTTYPIRSGNLPRSAARTRAWLSAGLAVLVAMGLSLMPTFARQPSSGLSLGSTRKAPSSAESRKSESLSVSYVAFAIHNGLHPDNTWGVGGPSTSENAADGQALRSCNANVGYGNGQCSSNGDCALTTEQWAAYAISTSPSSDGGPYSTGTACGYRSQSGAEAQAIQYCQANSASGCNIVWSGSGL